MISSLLSADAGPYIFFVHVYINVLQGYLGVMLGPCWGIIGASWGPETQLPSELYRNVCTSAESLSGSWSAELPERPAAAGSRLVSFGVCG